MSMAQTMFEDPDKLETSNSIVHQPESGEPVRELNYRDYLRDVRSFKVEQMLKVMEVLTSYHCENKYIILDLNGNIILSANEESADCERMCCGKTRSFKITLTDKYKRKILVFERPFDRCFCCCGYLCTCEDGITVSTGSDNVTVLKAVGPFWTYSFGGPVKFHLKTLDNIKIGAVVKLWNGWLRECYTNADSFSITFPIDLEVELKAICLGLLFLIDFQYYEQKKQQTR